MTKRMMIDATHAEETRVVVLDGNRLEDFDVETSTKRHLKGNIYLAKVVRVEPSLQAAFVEYGGNRHGFLAFSEIHPDYYQIPVADRQALLEADAEAQREEEQEEEQRRNRRRRSAPKRSREDAAVTSSEAEASGDDNFESGNGAPVLEGEFQVLGDETIATTGEAPAGDFSGALLSDEVMAGTDEKTEADDSVSAGEHDEHHDTAQHDEDHGEDDHADEDHGEVEPHHIVEQLGGGDAEEDIPHRPRVQRKQYKIQEVIKRRQILLVQVVKEERGNKGAALTTYLSLAGRYSVLMPNTGRGGGISRKITNAADRKRLKEIAQDLEVPEGMGVILRTAGASRTRAEIKRDFEYLMRLWESVRELTLTSSAPALVYEEGSLIKRAIRDLYSKDVDEVQVAGEDGYKE